MIGKIRHITRSALNTEAYDACIQHAINSNIYAHSWYLDFMADHWDALVLGNYDAVMPLPWRRKYGIRYSYMPAYTAALGIFSSKPISPTIMQAFLRELCQRIRFFELSFNSGSCFPVPGIRFQARVNHVLDLNRPYAEIEKGYRGNIRRNIKKAYGLGCTVTTDIPITEVTALAMDQLQSKTNLRERDFRNFESLYRFLRERNEAMTYAILGADKQVIASCAFVYSNNRAYYILVGNHPNGRTLGASHALIDAFIQDHAGQPLILDFEGSDIRNLAFFYSSFGASVEHYCSAAYNALPWWVRIFKK